MYLNDTKLKLKKILGLGEMIISAPFVVFWGLIFILAVFKAEGFDAPEDLSFSLGLWIPAIFVFVLGLRNRRLVEKARRYNSIFEANLKKKVSILYLSEQMNISQEKIMKEIDRLIRKAYLIDCAVEKGDFPKVLLLRGKMNEESDAYLVRKYPSEIVQVTCPNCGAPNKGIRDGYIECEYCGSVYLE